jgi:hypothetical protein
MAIETPKYEIITKERKFEIRQYMGYIAAEVDIEGDYDSAIQKGFRILAGYIFGSNKTKTHIKMTAPVIEQAVKSEKIPMTAPVTLATVVEGKKYRISFTMPSKYKLNDLPEPVSQEISFREVGPHKAVAMKFSGYLNQKQANKRADELKDWLNQNNLQPKSGFLYAQYNPPWIPGPFRKNEIILEI